MKLPSLALVLGLAVVCGSRPVPAADAYCSDVIDVMFAENGSDVALATIGGGQPRVNFVSGKTDRRRECPSERPSCRLKSYVVPGDAVLAGGSVGGFRCVTVRSAKGTVTSGFLPKAVLVEAPPTTPRLGDWTGEWVRDREASITIQSKGRRAQREGRCNLRRARPREGQAGGHKRWWVRCGGTAARKCAHN